ncbi:MAG: condensation domain-containing protein, partial [Cyanobacteria bacterium J06621_8]
QDLEFQHSEIYYRNNYPFSLVIYPNQELLIAISYDSIKFETITITQILNDIKILIQQLVTNPDIRIEDLTFLTSEQQQQAAILERQASFDWEFDLCC